MVYENFCRVKARIPSSFSSEQVYVYLYEGDHLVISILKSFYSKSLEIPRHEQETDLDRRIRGCSTTIATSFADVNGGATGNGRTDKFDDDIPVRIHSSCFTGETLHSLRCDCGIQLENSFEMIAELGGGIIIYLQQEGRGIGLEDKLKAYNLQDLGYDTVTANELLKHPPDARDYSIATEILNDLGINKIKLITNNPDKINQMNRNGIQVSQRIGISFVPRNESSKKLANETLKYLSTKALKMAHMFDIDQLNMKKKSEQECKLSFAERLSKAKSNRSKEADDIPEHTTDNITRSRSTLDRKRLGKNSPQELSSKKPVSRKRIVIESQSSQQRIDPRFDPMCGKFNKDLYEKSFAFLTQYEEQELQELKKDIEKCKDLELERQLKKAYESKKSRLLAKQKQQELQNIKREWKKSELEKVSQGKRPYFPKKSDFKRIELTKKFEQLKEKHSGSSDKKFTESIELLMKKKRKRDEKKERPVAAIAYASNPNTLQFQQYIEKDMKRNGSNWIDRNVVSRVSALVHERKDFYLFSFYYLSELKSAYIGIFGTFFKVPYLKIEEIN